MGATYNIPTPYGAFTLAAQYSYNSGFYFAPDNRVKQPAFSMVNSSVEWLEPDGRWGLRLWGKNLANEKIVSYNSEQAFGDLYAPAPPLTFGGNVIFHFGALMKARKGP